MKITSVDTIRVQVPCPEDELRAGKYGDVGFVRIETDEGLTGWGAGEVRETLLDSLVRPLLIASDPFRIGEYVSKGLGRAPSAEHALWDLLGKATNLPIYRLLGGPYRDEIQLYATVCWPTLQDTPIEVELEDTIKYVETGYRSIKLQIWHANPFDNIEMFQHLRDRFGSPEKVQFMFDRTASFPGSLWDVETALEIASALCFLQAEWLEEPLEHGDIHGYARLSESVDLPIAAGERDFGLEPFIRYGTHKSLDIWQPDAYYSGGILTVHRIAALAQRFHIPLIMHGANHFLLAPVIQLAASIESCRMLEVAMITPPFRPEEQWEPLLKLVNTPHLFEVEGDVVKIPTLPGLGLDLNEDAILEYQVPPGTPRRPDPYEIVRPIFMPDDHVRMGL